MHLIEVREDNVLKYRIQINSKRIFYMYSIVLYNRVLENNYFIIASYHNIMFQWKKLNSFWNVSLELQYIQILEHKIFKIKHSFFLTKTGFKFVEWKTKFSEHSVHIYKVSKYMQSIKIRPN